MIHTQIHTIPWLWTDSPLPASWSQPSESLHHLRANSWELILANWFNTHLWQNAFVQIALDTNVSWCLYEQLMTHLFIWRHWLCSSFLTVILFQYISHNVYRSTSTALPEIHNVSSPVRDFLEKALGLLTRSLGSTWCPQIPRWWPLHYTIRDSALTYSLFFIIFIFLCEDIPSDH